MTDKEYIYRLLDLIKEKDRLINTLVESSEKMIKSLDIMEEEINRLKDELLFLENECFEPNYN